MQINEQIPHIYDEWIWNKSLNFKNLRKNATERHSLAIIIHKTKQTILRNGPIRSK